ncbi:MAG: tRNA (adenosine(37)-N6)-threonylcarbamoyltransferase complex transferase subunit TsaD [bacterium]|nr:tRNA (adenosine(37)-N6)-threonylcarbamoyltransferase complex transferase subunit TsaD [bacterium]
MVILSLETSCDETACAILEEKNGAFSVLANIVSSQISLHAKWGGVVPNLAAREHLKNIMPVIDEALTKAHLTSKDVDLIAVTNGPGLIPALLIGVETAKTLSYLWKKPLIGIHHIEGHIYANFIDNNQRSKIKDQEKINSCSLFIDHCFPVLCLVVSGGHTQLVLMKKHLSYEIIGETQDDAVGEAFDKVARILGLGYPGGPAISATAEMAADYRGLNADKRGHKKLQRKSAWQLPKLPRPMIKSDNFNFSFSGLKTAVLYSVKKNPDYPLRPRSEASKLQIANYCYEFQQAVCDVLISKTIRAAKKYNPKTIMLAGGVSANTELRKQLGEAIKKDLPDTAYRIPETKYSIDNATMIAIAASFRYKLKKNTRKLKNNWKNLETNANLKLK